MSDKRAEINRMLENNHTTRFYVSKVDDRWMAIGRAPDGDEVRCDGAFVKDRRLAERIAVHMRMAYEQGMKDTIRMLRGQIDISKKEPHPPKLDSEDGH